MSLGDIDPRALIIDFGSAGLAMAALEWTGRQVEIIGMATADAFGNDPEALARRVGSHLGKVAPLVFAFGDGPDIPVSACDWDDAVHLPLARCFAFVRALGPIVRARGGDCVALLPVDAVILDGGRGVASTLHRALLGLFESLRAESAESDMRTSIVFLEPEQDVHDLARRFEALLARGGMYSLPRTVGEGALTAQYRDMLDAAEATGRAPDFPLPPTPMGMVYAREIEAISTR